MADDADARAVRVLLSEVTDQFGDWGTLALERLRCRPGRATPAKLAVLAALAGDDGRAGAPATESLPNHLTALELLASANKFGIHLDETSIYRTVERLEAIGMIHHVNAHDGAARYGLNEPAHHHAICSVCGDLRAIRAGHLARLVVEAAQSAGLVADAAGALLVRGRCAACRGA